MRFLFTTLQTYESEFYGRVGEELAAHGHEAAHVTISRASSRRLTEKGIGAWCLADVAAELGPPASIEAEVERIEAIYDTPHIRDVYRADPACRGQSEAWCVERTVFSTARLPRTEMRSVRLEN